jgi:hypothetical protein
MKHYMKKYVFSVMLLGGIVLFASSSAFGGYSVAGSLYAYATAGDGDPVSRSFSYTDQTSLTDTASYTGHTGAVGQAEYFANWATGLVGTYVSGCCPVDEAIGTSASGTAQASFSDELHVAIPTGTYESDLYVTLSGFVNGYLSASGIVLGSESNVYEVGNFKLIGPGNFPSKVASYDLAVADTQVYSYLSQGHFRFL